MFILSLILIFLLLFFDYYNLINLFPPQLNFDSYINIFTYLYLFIIFISLYLSSSSWIGWSFNTSKNGMASIKPFASSPISIFIFNFFNEVNSVRCFIVLSKFNNGFVLIFKLINEVIYLYNLGILISVYFYNLTKLQNLYFYFLT